MLHLLDKGFKSTNLNMFKALKETISKELKESMRLVSHQIESINQELEIIGKKYQTNSEVEKV